jgi:hypothetical protein
MHKTLCCNRIGILARLRLSGLDRFGKSMPFGPAVLLTRWSYLGKVFRRLVASLIECQYALLAETTFARPSCWTWTGGRISSAPIARPDWKCSRRAHSYWARLWLLCSC